MYALSLGFIIFISVAYTMTIDSFNYGIQQSNGVYIGVYADGGQNAAGIANQISIINELEVTPAVRFLANYISGNGD